MSRSYKRTPVLKDSNTSKKASKRMANKIVRKTDFDVLTSKSKRFRKVFDTWNIYDYRIYDVEKRWTRK